MGAAERKTLTRVWCTLGFESGAQDFVTTMVLIGKQYWQRLVDLLRQMVEAKTIDPADMDLLLVTLMQNDDAQSRQNTLRALLLRAILSQGGIARSFLRHESPVRSGRH